MWNKVNQKAPMVASFAGVVASEKILFVLNLQHNMLMARFVVS
jgi:hypothetical protein